MESLEDRHLLAAVSWDGGGGDLLWNTAENWSEDALPVAGDDVVIAGTAETITFDQVLELNSLSSETSLRMDGGQLSVTTNTSISSGEAIYAEGSFASFTSFGTANISGVSLIASAGGTIAFNDLTSYAHASGTTENIALLSADGENSVIDLRGVTAIANGNGERDVLSITATDGGQVDLRSLTSVSTNVGVGLQESYVEIIADGDGSTVDLSSLISFSDSSEHEFSRLLSSNGGVVEAGNVQALANVEVQTDNDFFSETAGITILGDVRYESQNPVVSNGVLQVLQIGMGSTFDLDAAIQFGSNASLVVDDTSVFAVDGDVSFESIPSPLRLDGVVRLDGGSASAPQRFEVFQADDGTDGFNAHHPNFYFRSLEFGDTSFVQLVDLTDNSGEGHSEALYVDEFTLPVAARIDLDGLSAYAINGILEGTMLQGHVTFDDVEPLVTSVTGLPGEAITSADILSAFSIGFSERLNPNTVLADSAIQLLHAGFDDEFGTADDLVIDLATPSGFGEYSTSVDLATASGLQLASGRYQLSLRGLTDRAGNPLDGDADGTGGDDFLYEFTMFVKDLGDAPAPYPTLLSEDGPRHEAIGPSLGGRTSELDGKPSSAADGDTDDGVTFYDLHIGSFGGGVTVNVAGAPEGAALDAWIDFNQDGDWEDAGEQIFVSQPVVQGNNNLRFDIPVEAADSTVFGRFRLSTAGGLSRNGRRSRWRSGRLSAGNRSDLHMGR